MVMLVSVIIFNLICFFSWMLDPLGSSTCIGGRRRTPRGGSLKETSSTGMGIARAGPLANLHKRLGPSQSTTYNNPVNIFTCYVSEL